MHPSFSLVLYGQVDENESRKLRKSFSCQRLDLDSRFQKIKTLNPFKVNCWSRRLVKSYNSVAHDNFKPRTPTGSRIVATDDFSFRRLLKDLQNVSNYRKANASFQLHPKVYCTAEKRDGARNRHKMGGQGERLMTDSTKTTSNKGVSSNFNWIFIYVRINTDIKINFLMFMIVRNVNPRTGRKLGPMTVESSKWSKKREAENGKRKRNDDAFRMITRPTRSSNVI